MALEIQVIHFQCVTLEPVVEHSMLVPSAFVSVVAALWATWYCTTRFRFADSVTDQGYLLDKLN